MLVNESQTPLVSVIMNCYNGGKFLKEAIDSIYAQTYSNWEIIFWDNASTDDSACIANSYDDRLKYHLALETTSLGEARGLALKKITGEYISFLDCDDIWLPKKLYEQIEIMENNKEYKMCYGGGLVIDESGILKDKHLPRASSGDVFKHQLTKFEIPMNSVLIRSDIPLTFNNSLEYSPDYDLMLNIASRYKVFVIRDYLIKYRIVSGSLTFNKSHRWWIERKYTLDSIFTEFPDIMLKYPEEHRQAYAKVGYYKARHLFMINEWKKAVFILSESKFISIKFFLLYVISLFGVHVWNYIHSKYSFYNK